MPSPVERRTIDHFISEYNLTQTPKIVDRLADSPQEAPDAICKLENGSKVALELTSVYPPKKPGVDWITPYDNLKPLHQILRRKLLNHYRGEDMDQAWLLVHIRRTLPSQLITEALKEIQVPSNYDRIFLQWPMPINGRADGLRVLDLPKRVLWLPRRNFQKIS